MKRPSPVTPAWKRPICWQRASNPFRPDQGSDLRHVQGCIGSMAEQAAALASADSAAGYGKCLAARAAAAEVNHVATRLHYSPHSAAVGDVFCGFLVA